MDNSTFITIVRLLTWAPRVQQRPQGEMAIDLTGTIPPKVTYLPLKAEQNAGFRHIFTLKRLLMYDNKEAMSYYLI